MKTKKVGKAISRLAVVTKDFSTYYIPGITMIGDKKVNQIAEMTDSYEVLDDEGQVLSSISKSAPVVADWTDLYEGPDPDFIQSDEVQEALVSFGNWLFNEYGVMVHSSDGKNEEIYGRQVCHADLANWEHDLYNHDESEEKNIVESFVETK